ncbi:histidine kinase [Clostridia bacterium]|nr:histidine kinase [Clostridia bacterium]
MGYAQMYDEFQRSTKEFDNLIEARMQEIVNICYTLSNNASVRSFYIGNFADAYEAHVVQRNVEDLLITLLTQRDYIHLYMILERRESLFTNFMLTRILAPKSNLPELFYLKTDIKVIMQSEWYKRIQGDSGMAIQFIDDFSIPGITNDQPALTLLSRLRHGGNAYGYIAITMVGDWLSPLFDAPDGSVLLLNENSTILYKHGDIPPISQSHVNELINGPAIQTIYSNNRIPYVVSHSKIHGVNLHNISIYSLRPLYISLFYIILQHILVGAFFTFVVFVISNKRARDITTPLTTIIQHIVNTTQQPLNITVSPETVQEIAQLAICLNQMSLRIDQLYKDLLKSQRLSTSATIYALKQQINPHFLYNTLETINSMALLNGCEEISQMVCHLSNMFRYALDRQQSTVLVSEEIDHFRSYLEISRIKGIQFRCDLMMSSECLNLHIQPLILQPLVENCFKHGFQQNAYDNIITIEGELIERHFSIRISDNGKGMSPEQVDIIQKLMLTEPNEPLDHYGIHNVHWRLRLAYGDEYGITLKSELGRGSLIVMTLPIIFEEV